MSDINNLGTFADIKAVWAKYPEGGKEGDYLTINGTKYRWNKYDRIWENAATFTESPAREIKTFYGDVDIHNDLTVGGTLRAKNVKQPNCGLFSTLDALKAAYPKPEVGMWAIVGNTIAGPIYRCDKAGIWTATGENGGAGNLDLSEINKSIENLNTKLTTETKERTKKDSDIEKDVATLTQSISKTDGILKCDGILAAGNIDVPDGLYLQQNDKGTITTLTQIASKEAINIVPVRGKLYLCDMKYYAFNGKEIVFVGGASESGKANGFFNITQEAPVSGRYHNLQTALQVLAKSDIKDADKKGMIITFESAANVWSDYRFVGTDIGSFLEPSAWVEYGSKGAIKSIKVTKGANSETLTPDTGGNVNLDIPVMQVDETIDANSTNAVQNKAVAAEMKSIAGKYGAAIRLNTIGEGNDKGYSLSLLTENGEELSTSDVFTGGGGGSIATTKVVLTRLSTNPTVKSGDEVKLKYSYDQIDTTTNESTGNSARVTVTVTRGATANTLNMVVPAGTTQQVDVTPYLGVGINNVRVRAEVGEGAEMQVSSISWTVNVIQLNLTSSFSISSVINKGDNVVIPYTLSGSGTKTLRCYVDGADKEDRTISTSTANGSFAVSTASMPHGAHSVQLVAELELADGSTIKSNSIYMDMAVREFGNNTPIIATRFDYKDGTVIATSNRPYIQAKQYENVTIVYTAYNPSETPTKVDVYEAGTLVSSKSVAFVTTNLLLRAMNYGKEACKIVCGNTEYTFDLVVEKSDLNLVRPTDGLQIELKAQGRTNADTNKDVWENNGFSVTFDGFNWGGNGWVGNALRHTDEARSVIKYQPLKQPENNITNASTWIVRYKVSEVVDDNTPVISCLDDKGVGFVITATEARMQTTGGSSLLMPMASDNTYEVGFVSFPKKTGGSSDYETENTEMVYLYINGIMSGAVQRGISDSIYQNVPEYIKMGSGDATLDVYLVRGYNTFLNDDQMLSCYILDMDTVDDLLSKYNANNILDGSGNISVENIPQGMRVVIVTGKQANGVATLLQAAVTNNKKTKYDVDEILTYVKGGVPAQNFRLIGGCISLQGTSSLAYPVKNYRFYLYNSAKANGKLYIGCNEQGEGGTLDEKCLFSFRPVSANNKYAAAPVNCFCAKADYAESSSSHNTGMARIVQDTLTGIGELTPAQKFVDRKKYQYDVRTTVDGEPCLLFYRNTVNDTPVFLGKYNWNNDKSTEAVFGFRDIAGYHDQPWVTDKFGGKNPTECWEFLNNDYPMGMFLDDDFDTKADDGTPNWMKVFEARFPDDSGTNAQYAAGTKKPTYLEALVKWVKSTDTTVQGLSQGDIAARKEKFRNELANYFDVKYLCDYYELTDINACVDQRVKNMMLAFWYNPEVEKMLAYMIFYDNDTIFGVRNDGRLKYAWDVNENTIDTELSTSKKTVYAFAGHDSVLWKNLRENFPDELKKAYIRIRTKMTNDRIFEMFDTNQSDKFCERLYNIDAINKYVIPKTIGVKVLQNGVTSNIKYDYLEAMQGSRKAHRHWFVTSRMELFDAWASTGDFTATDLTFKGNSAAGATIKAVAARDFYFEFRREGESMTHDKVEANNEWSYTYNNVANIGTIFHFLGGRWVKKMDLSLWGGFTDISLPKMPVLKELIMGTNNSTYGLTQLVLGNNMPMLENLQLINYNALTSIDLSGCARIKTVNATGCSSMSTMTFAQGAPVESLHLPINYHTLTLRSLPHITREGITFDNIRSITGLWIENCAKLDGFTLFKELFALDNRTIKYVRLTGLNLEGDGSDLKAWYDAGIRGIDAGGNITNAYCTIAGNYQLTTYTEESVITDLKNKFPELNINNPAFSVYTRSRNTSDPAAFSNYDNRTGYDFGNDYVCSGHVKDIIKGIYRFLGKQRSKTEMLYYPLHNDNSNYFADAEDVNNCTPCDTKGTMGDVFTYIPHYWYKGITDYEKGIDYFLFSKYRKKPDYVGLVKDTTPTLLRDNQALLTSATVIDGSAFSANNSYAVYSVDVSDKRFKKIRFQPNYAESKYCAYFLDSDRNIVKRIQVETNPEQQNKGFIEGMSYITDIPDGASWLYFSFLKTEDITLNSVRMTDGISVYDMEDWVEHAEISMSTYRVGVGNNSFVSYSGKKPSIISVTSLETIKDRGWECTSYDDWKDVLNLVYMKYGTYRMTRKVGTVSPALIITPGASDIIGTNDSIYRGVGEGGWYPNPNQYGAYYRLGCPAILGFDSFFGSNYMYLDTWKLNNTSGGQTCMQYKNVYRTSKRIQFGTIKSLLFRDPAYLYDTTHYMLFLTHGRFMDVLQPLDFSGGASSSTYTCSASRTYGQNGDFGIGGNGEILNMRYNSVIGRPYGYKYHFRASFLGTLIKAKSVEEFKKETIVYF